MPFVLRGENTSENPKLAYVLGHQITEGILVYWMNENGRTKAIIILGEGEMSGVDAVYIHGEKIPEFLNNERLWRFHSGTITKKPTFKKTSSLDHTLNRLTISSHGFSNGTKVTVVGTSLPTGMSATDYYVKSIDSNTIELYTEVGLTTIVNFDSFAGQVSLYASDGVGFNDPEQGRPEFFPTLNYTLSGIAYIELNLTSDQSAYDDNGEPTELKFVVRGKKLQNYTNTGLIADSLGVAYPDQNNLPSVTKFYSNNNALAIADILINKCKMPLSRIDWASWAVFRDRCNGVIAWNSGSNFVLSYPNWTINLSTLNPTIGELVKSGTAGWGNTGATTTQTVTAGNYIIEGTYREGNPAIGIANNNTVSTYSDMLYSVVISSSNSIVRKGSTTLYTHAQSNQDRDRFKITVEQEVSGATVKFFKNDALIHTETDTGFVYTGGIRGAFSADLNGSKLYELKVYPLTGTARNSTRFTADLVFPNESPVPLALEQLFGRAMGCHWQDVNGKIKFIAYPDAVEAVSYTPGKRVIAKDLIYDPNIKHIKSNIVENSVSYFFKPSDEKVNFVRIEYRNADDEFLKKDYSFADRPVVRDDTELLIDSGLVQIGVATKSLADRMGEAILRFGTDMDLFVQLSGMPNCYEISKGDVVRLAHDIPEWDIYNSKLFIVIEEVLNSTLDTVGTKNLVLQIYNPEFYSDTEHGALPITVGSLDAVENPPTISSLSALQDTEQNGNTVSYSIKGEVNFNVSYGKKQKAKIYYKHPISLQEGVVNVEQLNAGDGVAPFTISPVIPGIYTLRIVTENEFGKKSDNFNYNFEVVENLYPRKELMSYNVSGVVEVDGELTKAAADGWTNGWGVSTRQIANTATPYKVNFTIETEGNYQVGLNYGRSTSNTDQDFAVFIDSVASGKVLKVKTNATDSHTGSWLTGDEIEFVLDGSNLKIYQIRGGVSSLRATYSPTQYPLTLEVKIYKQGAKSPKIYTYGNLQNEVGVKFHPSSIKSTFIDSSDDFYKPGTSGWDFPNDSYMFSSEWLDSDGEISFRAAETDKIRSVSLSYDQYIPTSSGQNTLGKGRYQIYLDGATYRIREYSTTNLHSASYSANDIFSIRRLNNNIFYLKNGSVVYSSSVPVDVSKDRLYVHIDINDNNGTVKDLRLRRVGEPISNVFFGNILIHKINDITVSSRPDNNDVFITLSAIFNDYLDDYTNTSSINKAKVRVFNKFNEIVVDYPPFTFIGDGVIGQGFHDRKYADPVEEAIYEIRVASNSGGYSLPIYYSKDVISMSLPTILVKSQSPQDLVAVPISFDKVNLTWVYSGTVDVKYRVAGGTWTNFQTSVTANTLEITGLNNNTYYEFKVVKSSDSTIFSNIASTTTLQQPLTAATYPAPSNLVATVLSTTQIRLNWVRNSTANDAIEVHKDGSLLTTINTGTTVEYTATGLTAGTSYTFKVRNKTGSNLSEYSNTVTATTNEDTSGAPHSLYAEGVSPFAIQLNWTNVTTSGTLNIDRSVNGASYSNIANITASGTNQSWMDTGLEPSTNYWYRIKHASYSGYSYAQGSTLDDWNWGGCVTLDTLIFTTRGWIRADEVTYEDHLIYWDGSKLGNAKVGDIFIGDSNYLYIIRTENGNEIKCTPSHPFIIDSDLKTVKADELHEGFELLSLTKDDKNVIIDRVTSIEKLKGNFKIIIFNILCREHVIICNKLISHNLKE